MTDRAEEFERRVYEHKDWVQTPSRLRALDIAIDVFREMDFERSGQENPE